MAQMSKAGDLTSGPMLKKIILFSLPLAASSFLQLLFNAADVVVVGRFVGSAALAAVPTVRSSTCWSTCLSALRWVQTLWLPAAMAQRMTRACTKRCRPLLP
jgi:Na+-driven multidrug efflux pump